MLTIIYPLYDLLTKTWNPSPAIEKHSESQSAATRYLPLIQFETNQEEESEPTRPFL